MSQSPEARSFVAAAVAWSRTAEERHAIRLIRSPFSGVAHEVAAAYAVVGQRGGTLLDSIARTRLAVGGEQRDALFAFAAKLEELRAAGEGGASEEALHAATARLFDLAAGDAPSNSRTSGVAPPALAEPVAPEAGSGVRTRHAHFSASALNTYAECARKWYYRYLCAAVEDKSSPAAVYGTAFHAALESLHAEIPHPSDAAPEDLRRRLEGYVNAAFERYRNGFGTAVEYELQRRRAQRTALRYADWLAGEARRAPFTVVGCELSARLDLEGYDFIGYIDRLDRDDRTGNVTVIDYKTGAIAASASEYRDKVRQFKDFQLPFYYWARTAAGDRVTKLALVPLKNAQLDVRPIALEVVPVASQNGSRSSAATGTISIAELERARARMVEICRELSSGDATSFGVTEDPGACTYCVYTAACANRPAPAEEKFGR
ncbi:MAG: PD-(D/E)XK nuclease family protein [Vulcanimicrobiaceae bacterium]